MSIKSYEECLAIVTEGVPEFLKAQEEYSELLKVLAYALHKNYDELNRIDNAYNVDFVDIRDLSKIANTLGIQYPIGESDEVLRLILKYYGKIIKNRGTLDSIKQMVRLLEMGESDLYNETLYDYTNVEVILVEPGTLQVKYNGKADSEYAYSMLRKVVPAGYRFEITNMIDERIKRSDSLTYTETLDSIVETLGNKTITLIIDGSIETSLCSLNIVSSGNITVVWGDGSPDTISPSGNFSHNYATNSVPYTVLITSDGYISGFNVEYVNNTSRITTANIETDTLSSMSFRYCRYLTDVTLPTSLPLMTSANYMFEECNTLVSIDVSSLSNVVTTIGMFVDCFDLTTINGWSSLSGVTDTSSMFLYCISLVSVDFSILVNLVTAYKMCADCTAMPTAVIEDLVSLQNAANMFEGCTLLSSVTLSNLPALTNTSNMFWECTSLPSIDVSALVNVNNTEYMFFSCTSLPAIDISAMTSIINASYMFYNCTLLSSVDVSNLIHIQNAVGMFKTCSSLVSIDVSDLVDVRNGSYMFGICPLLTTVDITPMTLLVNASYMFIGCSSLTSMDLTGLESLMTTSHMVFNCSLLTSVTFVSHPQLEDVGYMFYGCGSLPSVDVSSLTNAFNAYYMFYSCFNLTSIDISIMTKVYLAASMFANCTLLSTIIAHDFCKDSIEDGANAIDNFVFNCSSLTSLDLTDARFRTVERLNAVYTSLYDRTLLSEGTITVTGVAVEGTSDKTIATDKNWNVVASSVLPVDKSGSDSGIVGDIASISSDGGTGILDGMIGLTAIDNTGTYTLTVSILGVGTITIDWGDGTINNSLTHTYGTTNGTLYTIHITATQDITEFVVTTSATVGYGIITAILKTPELDSTAEMFQYCKLLTDVTLPESVLELENANRMFLGCVKLASLVGISSLSNILYANRMFFDCTLLTSIDVSDLVRIVDVDYMFYQCVGLTSLDVSALVDISALYAMFYGCNHLTSLLLPSSLPGVTTASLTFYNCSALTSLDLPDLALLGNATSMFQGCTGLTSIDVSSFVSLTNASNMFYGCNHLTSITGLIALTKLTNISSMIRNCSLLTSINATGIGSGSTGISNSANFVLGCSALTYLDLTNSKYTVPATYLNAIYTSLYNRTSLSAGITYVTGVVGQELSDKTIATNKNWNVNAGEGAITLTALDNTGIYTLTAVSSGTIWVDWGDGTINNSLTHTYGTTNGTIYTIHITATQDITQFKVTTTAVSGYGIVTANLTSEGLTTAEDMFQYCSLLTSVTLPASLDSVLNTSLMFAYCVSLTTVDVSMLGNVENAENMFRGCTLLDSISVIAMNSITNANSMFFECSSLASINISLMTQVTDTRFMFSDCTSLTSINTNGNLGLLVLAEGMFTACTSLTNAVLSGCYSLEDIYGMFFGCSSLENINLFGAGSGSTGINAALGFTSGCDLLDSVTLNDSKFTDSATLLDTIYTYLPDRTLLTVGYISLLGVIGQELSDITIATNKNWNVETATLLSASDSVTSSDVASIDVVTVPLGDNMIKLTALDNTGVSPYLGTYRLYIESTGTTTVDWGDGTVVTVPTSGYRWDHTYSNTGTTYTINISSTANITVFRLMGTPTSGCGVLTAELTTTALTTAYQMFSYGLRLTSVILPSSLTSVINATEMFDQCYLLTTVDISMLVNVTDANSMFKQCYSLTSVVGLEALSNVTDAYYMFYTCESLTSIDITDMVNIQDATAMFYNSHGLTSIDVTGLVDINTSLGMFFGCHGLTSISGLNSITLITNASSMFYGCSGLTSIDISTFTSVLNASALFIGCSGLTSIDVSSLANATNTISLFSGCAGLTSIDVSDLVDTLDTGGMFNNCSNLASITGLSSLGNSTNTSNMFTNCIGLTSIDVSPFTQTTNTSSMFYGCTGLTSIDISALTKTTNVNEMFRGCDNIVTITATGLGSGGAGISNGTGMLLLCPVLTSVDLTNSKYTTYTRLDAVYTSLYYRNSLSAGSIIVTGANVEATSTKTIATGKNWTVTPA